jgi:hypothetical protein
VTTRRTTKESRYAADVTRSDLSVGDIAYYAPWGNPAIFYRDFGYSRGLIQFGQIDSGIEALHPLRELKATIERVDKE